MATEKQACYYRPAKLRQKHDEAGRRGLYLYIAALVLGALVVASLLAVFRPYQSALNPLLAAAFLTLVCLAGLYPVHVAPKTKVSVTSAAIFAAVLLFDPLTALVVGGGGVALTQLITRKKDWPNRLFSTAQAVLFSGTAAMAYGAMVSLNASAGLFSAYGMLAAVTAAAAMYMVNSMAVSLAAGLQMHKNPLSIWVSGTRQSVVQEIALFSIGLASAMMAIQAPWALVLMLVPVVVIYYSFKRMTALNARVESQLTELHATQAQLVESARMASIGTMVAGIAHQINNPMFVIRGRAETLVEDADEHLKTPSARKSVQVIYEMADRVSRIVNSLLPNSHVSEEGVAACDVNEVVRNTLLLLEPKLLKTRVEVGLELAEKLPLCLGDACEFQEVIINLVDNACNAMPQGGKLSITTRETDSGVAVRVADNGPGIAPENLKRVFNPFFTTRKGSGGVGLGLYMSRHIIEKHGGRIAVDSAPGAGTVFNIMMPVQVEKRGRAHVPPQRDADSRLVASGSGTPRRVP